MIIARSLRETEIFLSGIRSQGRTLGLVPTMGALHEGHISLVNCCRSENDITAVSIFVNPEQFNDPGDLENYPRNVPEDLKMLKDKGCDFVFVPGVRVIYPQKDHRDFDFGTLGNIMEGHFRPGHFNGVAKVVSRLFEIIRPDRAYFGEKDIQQLAIIKKLVRMDDIPVEIRACPTLRENDGLAMSSRNALLSEDQRKNAALISHTLKKAAQKRTLQINELKQWVADTINQNPFLELEYFEIIDKDYFKPVSDQDHLSNNMIGCIAVKVDDIRLIDNIFFSNFDRL